MFDVRITNEQRQYAWDLTGKTNFGKRGVADGDRTKQYVGMLGQTVMADLIGAPRPTGAGGFDHGVDFILNERFIDLKTMARQYPVDERWTNNLYASQVDNYDDFHTELYVFSSINTVTKVMTFVGAFKRSCIKSDPHVKFKPAGTMVGHKMKWALTVDKYEIDNVLLWPINNVVDLMTCADRLFI